MVEETTESRSVEEAIRRCWWIDARTRTNKQRTRQVAERVAYGAQ